MTMARGCTAEDKRAYRAFCLRLTRIVVTMEVIGETEMGVLDQKTARRFHRLTNNLRLFTTDLINGAEIEQ